MRRILKLLLLLLSSLCWSQSPITVTGTVVDTSNHPATNGYIQFDLTPANQGLTYQIPPSTVIANSSKCKINLLGQPVDYITGAAPCLLWPNDLILPANTLYTVTLAPNGRVSRVYNNALFTVLVNPQSLATLRFIQPQPVIGTIINASPLVTQSMVPSNDLAWTIGQPNQRYVNIFTNSIYDYGLPDGCLNSTAFHIGSTGAPCIGGLVGSGTANQVAVWTGLNTLSGFTNLKYISQGISVGVNGVNGGISFIGSAGGSSFLQAQSNAGNGTVLMPSFAGFGTMAVTASSPLVLNSTTGNLTCPTCGAGGSVSGSGTINQIPLWTGGTALGDSILTQVGSDTIIGPSTFNLNIGAGNTTTTGGSLVLNAGVPSVSGAVGNIILQPGTPPGSSYGQVIIEDSSFPASGISVAHSAATGNGYLKILNGSGGAASLFAGTGTPSFTCPVPSVYFKTNPSSASDLIWVCLTSNTWTALAVP